MEDVIDKLFDNPDIHVLMYSMVTGYGLEDYQNSKKKINLYFDFERNDKGIILILSKDKLKSLHPNIENYHNLDTLDERMGMDNYKHIASDLCKMGIDINYYIVEKLLDRHKAKCRDLQFKLQL